MFDASTLQCGVPFSDTNKHPPVKIILYPKKYLMKIHFNIIPTTETVALRTFPHQTYIYIYVLFTFPYPIYVASQYY
jgi:hypothetical protein